ncbi:hypothetical protein WJX77_000125 [Trebouxia sp. C0004]
MSIVDAAKQQISSAVYTVKDKASEILTAAAPINLKKQDLLDLESGLPPSPSKSHGPSSWSYIASFKWARPIAVLVLLYCVALLLLLNLFWKLPSRDTVSSKAHLQEDEELLLKLPTNFQEAQAVKATLALYKANCNGLVITLLICLYLFMQVFMIPGAMFINVLAGSLYGLWGTFCVIACVSTLGAGLNYWLARLLVREVLLGLFPGRIDAFGKTLQKHKQHLTNYMIFLRVTPFLPSWFINTASPVVGFPFREYIMGTAVGLQPLNFILVQAGQTLGQLHSYRDLYSFWNISKLGICAILAVSPVLCQRFCSSVPRKRTSFRTPRRTSLS